MQLTPLCRLTEPKTKHTCSYEFECSRIPLHPNMWFMTSSDLTCNVSLCTRMFFFSSARTRIFHFKEGKENAGFLCWWHVRVTWAGFLTGAFSCQLMWWYRRVTLLSLHCLLECENWILKWCNSQQCPKTAAKISKCAHCFVVQSSGGFKMHF